MDTKAPYTSPNFTIKVLAQKLKSNPTYISRALNIEGGIKFTDFVQAYRVKYVERELALNSEKLGLEELYKKAGFTHQSTFNRKFKELTGKTPSKYIDDLKKKNILASK